MILPNFNVDGPLVLNNPYTKDRSSDVGGLDVHICAQMFNRQTIKTQNDKQTDMTRSDSSCREQKLFWYALYAKL